MSNSFKNARVEFSGIVSGVDDNPHYLFEIELTEGPELYGEYSFDYLEDRNHFNILIGPFGYVDRYHAGDMSPSVRRHFSREESLAAEQLIRSFFLTSGLFDKRVGRQDLFLGGVSFGTNWIIQNSNEDK